MTFPPPLDTPCVYTLKTTSTDPRHLHSKGLMVYIGAGDSAGELDSIQDGAKNNPAFMFCSVRVVATMPVEGKACDAITALRGFFSAAEVSVPFDDAKGEVQYARHWFMTSPKRVEHAVQLCQSGTLSKYRYDIKSGKIVPKQPACIG